MAAIDFAEDFYDATKVVGVSVPATEYSVMCMGTKESEIETFRRLISDLYPSGIVSIVSDTWDFWKVITEYTVALKEEILNRKPNALGFSKVVFRSDSGDKKSAAGLLRVEKTADGFELFDRQSTEHRAQSKKGKVLWKLCLKMESWLRRLVLRRFVRG